MRASSFELLLDMELFFGYCYFVEPDYEGERKQGAAGWKACPTINPENRAHASNPVLK